MSPKPTAASSIFCTNQNQASWRASFENDSRHETESYSLTQSEYEEYRFVSLIGLALACGVGSKSTRTLQWCSGILDVATYSAPSCFLHSIWCVGEVQHAIDPVSWISGTLRYYGTDKPPSISDTTELNEQNWPKCRHRRIGRDGQQWGRWMAHANYTRVCLNNRKRHLNRPDSTCMLRLAIKEGYEQHMFGLMVCLLPGSPPPAIFERCERRGPR